MPVLKHDGADLFYEVEGKELALAQRHAVLLERFLE
jgi:hypothetical protein